MLSFFVHELIVNRQQLEEVQFALMYYGNGGFDWQSLEMMTIPEINHAVEFVIAAKQKEAEDMKKAQSEAKSRRG